MTSVCLLSGVLSQACVCTRWRRVYVPGEVLSQMGVSLPGDALSQVCVCTGGPFITGVYLPDDVL